MHRRRLHANKAKLSRNNGTGQHKALANLVPPTPLVPLTTWSLPELIRRLQTKKIDHQQPRQRPASRPVPAQRPQQTRPSYRGRPPRPDIPIIAITGTAGKTTTKSMLVSILKQAFRTVTTPGNDNLGAALPGVFRNAYHLKAQAMVLEMGMERRGQIAAQCRYTSPDIGVITNVSRGHLSKCGGFTGVIKAKNELVYGLRRNGTLILNADDPGTKLLHVSGFQGRIIRYGQSSHAAYRLLKAVRSHSHLIVSAWAEGAKRVFIVPAVGRHHAYNALAAVAAARCLGVSWSAIKIGLRRFIGARGRLTPVLGIRGSLILDDSFNANPLSMISGLRTLAEESKGRTTMAILGNMEEQGDQWRDAHELVGRRAFELGIDYLVTIGDKASIIARSALRAGMPRWRVMIYPNRHAAAHQLIRRIPRGSLILVKGSHSTGLASIVKQLARSS